MSAPIPDWIDTFPAPYRDIADEKWRALCSLNREGSPYRVERRGLPIPIWAARGLPDDAAHAWEALRIELRSAQVRRPISIYAHIPFCESRCPFCDCYAFTVRRHRETLAAAYTDSLIAEIALWAEQGNLAKRPVTTIHLGGGTPTMLGRQNLERLTSAIRGNFNISPNTEWALETTSSSLDEDTFGLLHQLGFRRLHIGVQSLQDDVRQAIGRRKDASHVISRINKALASEWIVSVDVIIGLPFQTPEGLLNDLDQLMEAGVEGFSIYELQQSKINRRFIEKFHLDRTPSGYRYLLFQLAFRHLLARGYSANVFNHLARGRDRNLYFTFPQRGEDLLALGAIADGVFGNYHYRHPVYLPYIRENNENFPSLQGGLRRSNREDKLHTLEVQIMGGWIHPNLFTQMLGEETAVALIKRWLSHQMIEETSYEGFILTPNGAWFTGQLLQETRSSLYPDSRSFK
jgi:coproporphyrinogen III oxidase-like Fe-S oxidoreductase